MEINIHNALPFAVKISLRPGTKAYKKLLYNMETQVVKLMNGLLKRPLLTTIVVLTLITIILSILFMSLTLLAMVFCFTTSIIMVEGLAIAIFIAVILLLILLISALYVTYFTFKEKSILFKKYNN